MITATTYPQAVCIRGVVLRYTQCGHCNEFVWLRGDQLRAHVTIYPLRLCEGSGRFYFHLFGDRMTAERRAA